MTNEPLLDSVAYVAILNALNAAHRATTDAIDVFGPRLNPILDAIDTAIQRTQEARRG